jgi:1,4-alpha-glucan branching enzyme
MIPVRFVYHTGLGRSVFHNPRLRGGWDAAGMPSDSWSETPMNVGTGEDGTSIFEVVARFSASQVGRTIPWGVVVDGPAGDGIWAIPTERDGGQDRHRVFTLQGSQQGAPPQTESYFLTHCRRLGANKHAPSTGGQAGLRFAVWAPNASLVEVVFGDRRSGYIGDQGQGISPGMPRIQLKRGDDGVWSADPITAPELADFPRFDHQPYMFCITNAQGRVTYRTDLYSRCQIGSGMRDPHGGAYNGPISELDGTKSCSVIVDPDTVTRRFREDVWPETQFVSAEDFWADELRPSRPLPRRVEDLVIYEMHIGGLFNGTTDRPGSLQDAINLLDHLERLGVNAIELLPLNEYEGWAAWGYGSSHFMAVEYSAGGRDQFKHFVRECHRRGLAVILDVVYNHYHHDAERAQWAYDSDDHQDNIYYWYEGLPNHYPWVAPTGHGGYLNNLSSGYVPRYHEGMVRKLFISSAVTLMDEFHVDGFRVDQTTSIHAYNTLNANGRSLGAANVHGASFLRELNRTLKMIRPEVILTAEDHSHWDRVTAPLDESTGMGFDASWYGDFYHHLVGDKDDHSGPQWARLLKLSGYGDNRSLRMDYFAGVLSHSATNKVVYHECHDEAGNAGGTGRTIATAVNHAPLVGTTRQAAEDRCRFCIGMALLSAGTPLFLMGEEVGASAPYRYGDFLHHRQDYQQMRQGDGARLFRFCQEITRLRLTQPALHSRAINCFHVHNDNRVIGFLRGSDGHRLFVAAHLGNQPFYDGYVFRDHCFGSRAWREIFNSDAAAYGGANVGNASASVGASDEALDVVLPARGFVVLVEE